MSSYNRFQLPPIKGTEIFPETIKTPPVVHASVEFIVDPDEAYNPEVLEDRAKAALAENSAQLGHFVQSQRQNFGAGISDYAKTSRSYPTFDVSYMNLQNRHEIITVNLRVDVRRQGAAAEEQEDDELMLLVLHDGNRLSAIPMSQLQSKNFDPSYTAVCDQSFWGNWKFTVNQLRLGDDYSAIASDIWLHEDTISSEFGAVMIATDDTEKSLNAYALDVYNQYPMNGSGGTIYLPDATLFYDGQQLTRSGGDAGSAVSADGSWSTVESDVVDYVNSVATDGGAVTVRSIPISYTTSTATNSIQTNYWDFKASEGSTEGCDMGPFVTSATQKSMSSEQSFEFRSGGSYDGIDLGSRSAVAEVTPLTFGTVYIVTVTKTYANSFAVVVRHWKPPRGDGAQYTIPCGGGVSIYQYMSRTPDNWSESPSQIPADEGLFCSVVVSGTDLCTGGYWFSTDGSIDACAQDFAGNNHCAACTLTNMTVSSGAGYTSTGTRVEQKLVGKVGGGAAYNFPYAVDDKIFYRIVYDGEGTSHTPYGQSGGASDFIGYFNVSNGQHLIQGFTLGEQAYTMLDGDDVGAGLAAAVGSDVSSINAIFMDIPLSKIKQFN